MKHICATLLLLCSGFNPQQDDRDVYIEQISKCALEYNAYYTEPENRIPIHLVVAVSAHESGWGTSRFVLEGNNYFGMKSYSEDPDEYMIPKGNKNVKLQKYLTVCDSVYDFMDLVSTSKKYIEFQQELERQWFMDYIEYDKLLNEMFRFSKDKKWKAKVIDIIEQIKEDNET